MDLFRFFNHVRLQEENWASFVSLIPEFIRIGKETEPEMLQYEAFANQERREVLWFESFRQIDGFDKHLVNPAHSDVQQKLMANKPEPLGMYFTYAPSEETVQGLVSFGFKVDVLTPWKGTNRLTESRHEDNVQLIAFLDVNDITAYQELAERIEEKIASQPGFLYHQSFEKSESQVFAMGEWADVSSLISWLKIFEEEFGKEFQSLVSNQSMYAACNKPTDELRKLMSVWNAPIYEKVAGFVRY